MMYIGLVYGGICSIIIVIFDHEKDASYLLYIPLCLYYFLNSLVTMPAQIIYFSEILDNGGYGLTLAAMILG